MILDTNNISNTDTMSNLIFEIKPKFYFLSRLFASSKIKEALALLLIAFISATGTVVMNLLNPDMINGTVDSASVEKFIIYISISAFIIGNVLSSLLVAFLDKKNFEVTNYRVYNDRINFDEGFINYKHSSILFKDIKEIHFEQNYIQKHCNVATIRFVTSAMTHNRVASIAFLDIEHAQEVYTKIKDVHSKVIGRN